MRLRESDEINQEFLARMNSSAKIHLTPAKVKGKYVIRFIALQESCNKIQIETAWKTIQTFATEILLEVSLSTDLNSSPRMEIKRLQRFSYTREVSKDVYERQSSM